MNVGIWIRVSTDMQAEGDSPETHLQKANHYCLAVGYEPVEIYNLAGVSGKAVLEHPEAKRMMQDVSSGKIKGLIFSKLARLARNVKELWEIAEHFSFHKAHLISIDERIDTSSPAGKLLFTITGALAEWEREEISARVKASVPVRARAGKKTSGQAPYGYIWSDKETIIINEEQAVIVRKAFDLFRSTKKVQTTAKMLNDMGYRSTKTDWTEVTLKRLLTNRMYIGEYIRNYTQHGKERYKPESEWIINHVPPIISTETWEAVQGIFSDRGRAYQARVPKDGSWTYSGLVRCACGEKMYVNPFKGMTTPRYICRACKNKIWESLLDEGLQQYLSAIVIEPEKLKCDTNELDAMQEQRKAIQSQLSKIEHRHQRLLIMRTDGEIERDTFLEQFKPLDEQRRQLTAEASRLETELEKLNHVSAGKKHLSVQAKSLIDYWNILTVEERRHSLEELIVEIVAGKESKDSQEITCKFKYLPETMKLSEHIQGFIAATNMKRDG